METNDAPTEPSLLDRIRNMWEFANLAQYLYIFGKAVKVEEDVDIEVRVMHGCSCRGIYLGRDSDGNVL